MHNEAQNQSGAHPILAARQRQLQPQPAELLRDVLIDAGALIAASLDLLPQQTPKVEVGQIDLLAPRMIFLDVDRRIVDSEKAVVVILPQYGLMYDLEAVKISSVANGVEIAAKRRTLGYDDWALIGDKEGELLVDRRHSSPATYPQLAKYTPFGRWYLTTKTRSSGHVWGVGFGYGYVNTIDATYNGFGRFVRRVSPSQLLALGL